MRFLRRSPDRGVDPVTGELSLEDRLAAYPQPRYRAAIIQFEGGHSECVPAAAHFLRLHGIEPMVYLNERIRSTRPGFKARFPELAKSTRFVRVESASDWHQMARRVRRSGADLVVLNTFQHPGPANWAAAWGGPLLGVVHDPVALQASEHCMPLVRDGRIGLLTLAPHATSSLMESDPVLFGRTATITSAFPHPPAVKPKRARRRRFAIPGSVTFASRDYSQLLDALPEVASHVEPDMFDVCVVGGGRDRQRLEELTRERGLAKYFTFARLNEHGGVPEGRYFGLLRGSTFMLPLSSPTEPAFRKWKITSAVPTSASLGVPLVIDRWTATAYDVPSMSFVPGELAEAMIRAITASEEDLGGLRRRLEDYRLRDMERATREMAYALRQQGMPI